MNKVVFEVGKSVEVKMSLKLGLKLESKDKV
jgi:hypothetical protein